LLIIDVKLRWAGRGGRLLIPTELTEHRNYSGLDLRTVNELNPCCQCPPSLIKLVKKSITPPNQECLKGVEIRATRWALCQLRDGR